MDNYGICIKHAPACDVEQIRERRTKISYELVYAAGAWWVLGSG